MMAAITHTNAAGGRMKLKINPTRRSTNVAMPKPFPASSSILLAYAIGETTNTFCWDSTSHFVETATTVASTVVGAEFSTSVASVMVMSESMEEESNVQTTK